MSICLECRMSWLQHLNKVFFILYMHCIWRTRNIQTMRHPKKYNTAQCNSPTTDQRKMSCLDQAVVEPVAFCALGRCSTNWATEATQLAGSNHNSKPSWWWGGLKLSKKDGAIKTPRTPYLKLSTCICMKRSVHVQCTRAQYVSTSEMNFCNELIHVHTHSYLPPFFNKIRCL